jgi:hypothetical protein
VIGGSSGLTGFETNIGGYLVYAGGGLGRAWLER